jgi:hypothetical protein
MEKNTSVKDHAPKAADNLGRTAENERVDRAFVYYGDGIICLDQSGRKNSVKNGFKKSGKADPVFTSSTFPDTFYDKYFFSIFHSPMCFKTW